MVALAKAYQDTDSSHSRTSRLRIINKLRRSDCFWPLADVAALVLDVRCWGESESSQPTTKMTRLTLAV